MLPAFYTVHSTVQGLRFLAHWLRPLHLAQGCTQQVLRFYVKKPVLEQD